MRREPSVEHLRLLGEFLHRLSRPDDAVAMWRQMASDGSATAYRETSHILQRYGYLPPARQMAQAAIDVDPNQTASWQSLLDVQLARQDYDAALATIQQMQPLRPDDAEWQRDVAQAQATTVIAAGRIDE